MRSIDMTVSGEHIPTDNDIKYRLSVTIDDEQQHLDFDHAGQALIFAIKAQKYLDDKS
ncbi:MAG: hypothetical protein OXD42_14565 [Rhodospirillaceae bacterium]|nr:hypothetical protein [Rhodospirillaceae bacterium]